MQTSLSDNIIVDCSDPGVQERGRQRSVQKRKLKNYITLVTFFRALGFLLAGVSLSLPRFMTGAVESRTL